MAPSAKPRSVAIVGTGLIGASIGLALKNSDRRLTIVGWDTNRGHARTAKRRHAIDRVAPSLESAASAADWIVLASPLESIVAALPRILRSAPAGAFIIDVAALKAPVLTAARSALQKRPDIYFAGGHPLAGSELSGPQHADEKLFRGRPFVVCIPQQRQSGGRPRQAARARHTAKQLIRLLGARMVELAAPQHDRLMAAASALPQLVATATALAVDDLRPAAGLVGPGYQGVTRLALSPFGPWKAALVLNRGNIRQALAVFEVRVRKVRRAIEKHDTDALRRLFRQAAAARRATAPR